MVSSTGQVRGLTKGYPVQKLEVAKRPAQRKGVSAACSRGVEGVRSCVRGWTVEEVCCVVVVSVGA